MDPERADPVRLVTLRADPLDVVEVLLALEDDAAGGLNVFVGTVRDHDHGRSVEALEYTAHPSALSRMREVAASVAEEYDVRAVAVVHREGRLVVGDAAVVTAVAAGHRGEAFEANRALIDRVKEQVPIWKHQVFTDGDEEWVGAEPAAQ